MLRTVAVQLGRAAARRAVWQGVPKTYRSMATITSMGDQTVEHNTKSETNRLSKSLQQFWDHVETVLNPETNRWEVRIDGKTIKTPLGNPLSMPKDKEQLAHLVAHEWANLGNLKIKTSSLPLTSLTARTVDLEHTEASLEAAAKLGRLPDIQREFLRYFNTDTCLIFSPSDEYEGRLRQRQDELFLPLIAEYEDFFTKWGQSRGMLEKDESVKIQWLDCETDGIRGNDQTEQLQDIVMDWMAHLPVADIVAMEKAILTAKSFLCGASLIRSNCGNPEVMKELYQFNKEGPETYFHKTVPQIIELGNLETIYQTEEWGEVEDTHDVDKVDWLRNLSAAALLSH